MQQPLTNIGHVEGVPAVGWNMPGSNFSLVVPKQTVLIVVREYNNYATKVQQTYHQVDKNAIKLVLNANDLLVYCSPLWWLIVVYNRCFI